MHTATALLCFWGLGNGKGNRAWEMEFGTLDWDMIDCFISFVIWSYGVAPEEWKQLPRDALLVAKYKDFNRMHN
jgi:hypothetical protein